MVDVVIIGQDEGIYAESMYESLPIVWRKLYVADRCDAFDFMLVKSIPFSVIYDTCFDNLQGRCTSYCRNKGLSLTRDNSDVLFLDGDRFVVEGDIMKAVENCETDILLFKCQGDGRTAESFKNAYGQVRNEFYSCGLFMRRSAIEKVRVFQHGELFREDMQQVWGIEDTYLGDVCYHLGLTASLCETVTLNGELDTSTEKLTMDAFCKRMEERSRLSVKWD